MGYADVIQEAPRLRGGERKEGALALTGKHQEARRERKRPTGKHQEARKGFSPDQV